MTRAGSEMSSAQSAGGGGAPAALLSVRDLDVRYGAICALQGVTLDIMQREIVTLIGSNGAGKTTLLRTISGLLRPASGTIRFGDDPQRPAAPQLERLRSHDLVLLR